MGTTDPTGLPSTYSWNDPWGALQLSAVGEPSGKVPPRTSATIFSLLFAECSTSPGFLSASGSSTHSAESSETFEGMGVISHHPVARWPQYPFAKSASAGSDEPEYSRDTMVNFMTPTSVGMFLPLATSSPIGVPSRLSYRR